MGFKGEREKSGMADCMLTDRQWMVRDFKPMIEDGRLDREIALRIRPESGGILGTIALWVASHKDVGAVVRWHGNEASCTVMKRFGQWHVQVCFRGILRYQ